MTEEDFVMEGWSRTYNPNRMITLESEFYEKPLKEQVKYLHKLASSYHEAAIKYHKELDTANVLLFKKEEIIKQREQQLAADRRMIQTQLAQENSEKQKLLAENQQLHEEIKRLEA